MRADTSVRIAYVVKRYPRFSETFIVNEILAHEAAGFSVEIFSLYPPNDTHFQDALSRVRAPVTYLTAEGTRAADLWAAITDSATDNPALWRGLALGAQADARTVYQSVRLAAEIRRRGITHVHAHFATVAASVAQLAASWANVPFTVTAHAKDIFHDSVTSQQLRTVLRGAARVITVSDFNLRYLTHTVGLPLDHITRIYNGLDLARFTRIAAPPTARRIVFAGRFVAKKGLDDLIRACALLRDRGVTFTCDLVGSGPEEAAVRGLIQQLQLQHQVRLPGPMPQQQLFGVMGSAAVFAAPCIVADDGDRDGLPTVLLEAMALGTPVVATDIVGIPEIVRDGETGLLVPARNPEQLADALARVLDSPALREDLARRARSLVEQEFDITRNAATLRSFFCHAMPRAIARAS